MSDYSRSDIREIARDVVDEYDRYGRDDECSSCHVTCLKKHMDAKLPLFAFEDDGAADLHSVQKEIVLAGQTRIIDTGIAMEIPSGWEGHIISRSGLAAKKSIHVLNSPGIIDAQYRNTLKVILHNSGDEDFIVEVGDRIAQIEIRRVPRITFAWTDKLRSSKRDQGGLGSTGVS